MNARDIYAVPALYDAEFGAYRADAPFYTAVLAHCAGPWLEPGCGTGRLFFQQDQPTHRYVGVDLAPTMLRAFRARTARRGLAPPQLLAGRMTALPVTSGAFGVCTLAYNVVQHLVDREALRQALAEAARVARHVALDVFMPPLPGMERWDRDFDAGEPRRREDGTPLVARERTRLDVVTGVQETVLRFEDAGGAWVDEVVFTRRLWPAEDILQAAEAAGLVRQWMWGDVFGETWAERSPRLMVLWQGPLARG